MDEKYNWEARGLWGGRVDPDYVSYHSSPEHATRNATSMSELHPGMPFEVVDLTTGKTIFTCKTIQPEAQQ